MMELGRLKARLAINKGSLDDEVSQQPMLFFEVAEACVEALAIRDACKEELASVDAVLDSKMRLMLTNTEEKVTEAMVKNAIQTHREHEAAFDTYMEAKTRADLLIVLKESFDQRRSMLKELSQLFIASYYEQVSHGGGTLDKAKYQKNRERLAEARAERDK